MPPRVTAARLSDLPSRPLPQLTALPDGISVWTAKELDDLRRRATLLDRSEADEAFQKALFLTIDILGARSQLAQEIKDPLTSVSRLHESDTYKLYLLTSGHRGMAILKMGIKKLFLTHPRARQLVEVDPLCVLDFYVDESSQRRGLGRQLFDHMLERERVASVAQLAIDRPSSKLLSFLRRHYGLADALPQVNSFVVFTKFFDNTSVTERGRLLRRTEGGAGGQQRSKNDSPGAGTGGGRAPGGREHAYHRDGEGVSQGGGRPSAAGLTPTPLPILPMGNLLHGGTPAALVEGDRRVALGMGAGAAAPPSPTDGLPRARRGVDVGWPSPPSPTPPSLLPFAVHPRSRAAPAAAGGGLRPGGLCALPGDAARLANEAGFAPDGDVSRGGAWPRLLDDGGAGEEGVAAGARAGLLPRVRSEVPHRVCNGFGGGAEVTPSGCPDRSPARPDRRGGGGDGSSDRSLTPQRHHQHYAKSRVTYNIITGEPT